jgi:mannose-1-phosphate guanylyltransferase
MHAVVLVGGFGTRLRPITYTTPKPLLPIAHVPMVERLVRQLGAGGVTHVVLALGFKPEPFYDAFPDERCGDVTMSYAVEATPLDTAGAIGFAARHADIDDTFVVANGDVMCDLDVAELVAFHRSRGAMGTISLTTVEDPTQFGIVEVDALGKVERFVEKPSPTETASRYASAGTYVFEPSALELMPGTEKLSIERVVFPEMVRRGALYAMSTSGYWIDAGRPQTYIDANLHYAQRESRSVQSVDVDRSAVVTNSVIAAGAVVGANARVEHSVLLPGARIEAGASVLDSIVQGVVDVDAAVRSVIVARDGVVARGQSMAECGVPPVEGA